MAYDSTKHHRRSIRLPTWDYRRFGAYYVTLCTQEHRCLFGHITDEQMHLNETGRIVDEEWRRSTDIRTEIELDAYVIMPNHVHGIVLIIPPGEEMLDAHDYYAPVGATGRSPLPSDESVRKPGPPPRSLGAFIAGFKSAATRRINALRSTPGRPVWQRNYWERVVRNEREWDRFRRYIANNPSRWLQDKYHPSR